MIREIFEKKVVNNLNNVVEIISAYFGNKYKKEFNDRANGISISLVKNKGVIKISDGEMYVGDEPVCIKENDGAQIILPISFLEDKQGNVVFVHLLLHALFNDSLKNECEELNEVIVDYMANDIAKILERKNINVTLVNNSCYESDSLYSMCFNVVENYCEKNKKELVDNFVTGDVRKLDGIFELSSLVEKRIESLLFEEVPKNKIKK